MKLDMLDLPQGKTDWLLLKSLRCFNPAISIPDTVDLKAIKGTRNSFCWSEKAVYCMQKHEKARKDICGKKKITNTM